MSKTITIQMGDCLPCTITDIPDDMTPEQFAAEVDGRFKLFAQKAEEAWKARIQRERGAP